MAERPCDISQCKFSAKASYLDPHGVLLHVCMEHFEKHEQQVKRGDVVAPTGQVWIPEPAQPIQRWSGPDFSWIGEFLRKVVFLVLVAAALLVGVAVVKWAWGVVFGR